MLSQLFIQNIAVIEKVQVAFEKGLMYLPVKPVQVNPLSLMQLMLF